MIQHFINISEQYYGEISYKDVICHRLLHKMDPQHNLQKSEEILEKLKGKFMNKDLDFDSKIEIIQRIINSLSLFSEFEPLKKMEIQRKIEMLKNISAFLKIWVEFPNVLEIIAFLEAVDCPINIQALIFGELFYGDVEVLFR